MAAVVEHVRWVRTEEAAQVAVTLERHLERRPDPSEVGFTLVLLDGLRRELAAPDPRFTFDQAHGLLTGHVVSLRDHRPG